MVMAYMGLLRTWAECGGLLIAGFEAVDGKGNPLAFGRELEVIVVEWV